MPAKKTKNNYENALFNDVEAVDINDLQPYHKNPRKGNVKAIAESLKENGQYRPIVVNRGTHTGRKNEVLGGNHTVQGAKTLGWKSVGVVFVDVDDESAARIVLADNRTNDLATYDTTILAEVMEIIAETDTGAVGTGYSDDDMKMLLQAIEKGNEDMDLTSITRPEFDDTNIGERDFNDVDFGDEDVSVRDDDPGRQFEREEEETKERENAPGALEKADEELDGAFSLKDDFVWPGQGYWGIPQYRDNMLMSVAEWEAIMPVESWAGSATRDWPDDEQWWMYNFGIDSTSGMKDVSKMVLAFYCWDDYFENWWHYPSRFVGKMLNSGVKYAVTPDYSLSSDVPRAVNLWQLYRNRWLGRYFQEAGIKIIPNIGWRNDDLEFLQKHVIAGLPRGLPMISMQCHTGTFEADEKAGVTQAMIDSYTEHVRCIVDTLQPEAVILYGGRPGREHFEKTCPEQKTFYVENRLVKLAVKAKNRSKKTTL